MTTSHEECAVDHLSLSTQGSGICLSVAYWSLKAVAMDIVDRLFVTNLDWDPIYLRDCVTQDFYDFSEHWQNSISDMEPLARERPSRYTPVVEDISLDDETLYEAIEQIEQE